MGSCAGGFADAGLGLEEIGIFIGTWDGGWVSGVCGGKGGWG